MLFDRILVPLDGSAVAEAVLSQVDRILRRADSELILLRVAPLSVYPSTELPVAVPVYLSEAKSYVLDLAARLSDQGARARGLALEGSPAETILDVVQRERATLITMATHGRGGLARWVFGSVAEKVLRASPVPVLVLRSFSQAGGRRGTEALAFKRILVPLARFHGGILPSVKELALLFGSSVSLLHVSEAGEDAEAKALARREAEAARAEFQASGISTEFLERPGGDAAQEILAVAAEKDAGLIAITTHGRSGPSRWALGSVTEKVLRSSWIPLLVVRNPSAQTPKG